MTREARTSSAFVIFRERVVGVNPYEQKKVKPPVFGLKCTVTLKGKSGRYTAIKVETRKLFRP